MQFHTDKQPEEQTEKQTAAYKEVFNSITLLKDMASKLNADNEKCPIFRRVNAAPSNWK